MRIAYVARFDFGRPSGVLNKILSQSREWQLRGHNIGLFLLTDSDTSAIPPEVSFHSANTRPYSGRILEVPALVKKVATWSPDVIYLRNCTYQPGFAALFGIAPVVLEINGNDKTEIRLVSQSSHLYNLATRALLLRRACGMVFVTRELAISTAFAGRAVPREVIGNGISLTAIPHRFRSPRNPQPHLFFIGSSGFRWHGIDKILVLAEQRRQWRFDIVGGIGATAPSLPPNVVNHGHLQQSDYAELLASADVAISTLALHRKMMEEASPLKTREYLAVGVPTMLAYRDTDFLRGAPFLLQLPNVEDNILTQIGRIDEFVQRMRGVIVPRSSVAHLDWSEKEPVRLAFFRDVVEAARLTGSPC